MHAHKLVTQCRRLLAGFCWGFEMTSNSRDTSLMVSGTKGHERIKKLYRDFFNHTSKTDSESKIITLAMEFFLKLSFTNRMAKSMEK